MSLLAGLNAYWAFDDGLGARAADATGNGNTLTVSATWAPGKINGALSYNGTSNECNVSDNAFIDPSTGMSVSAWINLSTGTAGTYTIVRKGYVTGSDLQYIFRASAGAAFFAVVNASGTIVSISGNTTLSAHTWYHLVGTYDGANLNLYVNGSSDHVAVAQTGNIFSSTQRFAVGATWDSGGSSYLAFFQVRLMKLALEPCAFAYGNPSTL